MKDVRASTKAKMPNTMANVPEIVFVKYKTTIKIAINIRILLSVNPMFFFIIFIFLMIS
jgi:hypothetical protein